MVKTKRISREIFNQKVADGQIMIGGLGNPSGVIITKVSKNRVWYK